ncbi:RecE family exodeoxyribonuclease [Pectobacterium versatile]|uniref:RecE family exodeoxyribonuclease n=1 Tax=Pectobacterium versatile TaxID=2488639 RepID=UPI002B24924F|nr:RecE family exodeoxyribonuclease [Pectobacterium versatile]
MNTFAFLIKAKAKSDKKSLFCWLSAKSDSRADREIMNVLEDEEIATGRDGDYNLPRRTDWFVVDDLPAERVLDETWCDRYELNDDGQSWRQIPKYESASISINHDHASFAAQTTSTQSADAPATDGTITIEQASFVQKVLGAWLFGSFTKLFAGQQSDISTMQHDMDATYVQNLLLALNNAKELLQAQHCFPETLFGLIDSIKSVWVPDGKAPSVGDIVSFSKEWLSARNEDSGLERPGPHRSEVTTKWAKKSGVQRTESGAIAGGDNKTDRNPDYTHTLDTLDIEIALATLPMDFDIYEIPVSLHRRAKEIITNKEEPFKTWSQKLRAMPGILDYSRAAIFALIRGASADITHFPDSMQRYINVSLAESDHANPTHETLQQARQHNSASTVLSKIDGARAGESVDSNVVLNTEFQTVGDALVKEASKQAEPEIKSLGGGVFSVDSLVNDSVTQQNNLDGHFYIVHPTTGKLSELFNHHRLTELINDGWVEIDREKFTELQAEFVRKSLELKEEFHVEGVGNVQMEAAGNQQVKTNPQIPENEGPDAGTIADQSAQTQQVESVALDNDLNALLHERVARLERIIATIGIAFTEEGAQ